MTEEHPEVSLIIPCHNEARNLFVLYERILAVMARTGISWEMVCVNDGSKDNTLDCLLALHHRDPRVVVIDLSRNFGKEAALTAGLDYCRGECGIPIDADLQDPPELIPELLDKWREGFDVVNAVRLSRKGESWFKRASAHAFYRFINRLSDTPVPEDTGDFRLLSRQVIEALRMLPERRRFMKGLFAWVGFRTSAVYYHRDPRLAGSTSWNYWKLWNLAIEGITSFSKLPLQIAAYIELTVSSLAFLYAAFLVVGTGTLLYGNPVKGYPSLMVTILFLGGVQLIALGIIGEYLGRVYEETKKKTSVHCAQCLSLLATSCQ